jgi:uncharacterized protein YggE
MRPLSPIGYIVGILMTALAAAGQATAPDDRVPRPPTLTVNGDADVSVRPDEATIELGALAQAEQASAAQQRVNEIVAKATEAIVALGVPQDRISTTQITLQPVYSQPDPRPRPDGRGVEPAEPRVVGYRAGNVVRVRLNDLSKVGPTIDAGVASGANQLQNLWFGLSDDADARKRALTAASAEARAKAQAIADALDVRLVSIHEVTEGGVHVLRPQANRMMDMAVAAEVATPVQPGQVTVNASVTLTYRIAPRE